MSQASTNSGSGVLPPFVATSYQTDSGIAIPDANVLNIFGTGGITTSGTGNTVTIDGSGVSSGIETIDGDVGSVTGSTVQFTSQPSFGYSTSFSGVGTIMTLNATNSFNSTFIGKNCGSTAGGGGSNVGLGLGVMNSIVTTTSNIGIGNFALNAGTDITSNVAIGDSSLTFLTNGGSNTAVGATALENLRTGGSNLALGFEAGLQYNTSESGNVLLNSQGVTGESNVLRIGDGTGSGSFQLSTAYVSGINGNTVSNTMMVTIDSSTDQLGTAAIPSGGIVTIDGDTGSATGSTVTLTTAGHAGQTVKFTATSSTVTYVNTQNGAFGGGNVAIGRGAGSLTLASPTNSDSCTFVGENAGSGNGAGIAMANSTAVGRNTLSSFTGTSGQSNTAIGSGVLANCTTGSDNVAVGYASLESLTDGSSNCALGDFSLGAVVDGSYNIGIGFSAGSALSSTESSNIYLNAVSTVSAGENNVLRIGDGTGSGQQQLATAFISGINGNTVSNTLMVTINSSTNQLGVASVPSGNISITGDSGGALTGNSFTFTGGTTGLTFAGASTTETLGGTLAIANGGTDATSFTQSNGIVTYNGTRLVNYAGPQISSAGIQTNTTQPSFFAYQATSTTNATGDGTTWQMGTSAMTTKFNRGSNFNTNGTFTAPVAGIYMFGCTASISNLSAGHTDFEVFITASGTNYNGQAINAFVAQSGVFSALTQGMTCLVSMAASDTAVASVSVANSTKTVTVLGSASPNTYFYGYLVC